MKQLLRILTVHSVGDLLRYKSFLLLVFVLLAADHLLHRFVKAPEKGFAVTLGFSQEAARFVFTQLPGKLAHWLLTPRVALIVLGLFFMKQVISLWPSSDMRRMHRQERGRFGVLQALAVLRWQQVAWDAMAVGLLCVIIALWAVLAYGIGFGCWQFTHSPLALLPAVGMAAMAMPITMAGFSYSSKLAVIQQGLFVTRFSLFLRLFSDGHLLRISWLFFACRIVVEFIFVAAIPAGAMLLIEHFWLRMAVATLSATPVYSYLKMASFKFFLHAYRRYDLVRQEYQSYFTTVG